MRLKKYIVVGEKNIAREIYGAGRSCPFDP